jgi:hypothetical protein
MSDASREDALPAEDAGLLAELSEALGRDPLPAGLLDRAEGLLAWMDVERELAGLLDDADVELAGTRGGVTTGLVFATPGGDVAVEVTFEDGGLAGQVLAGEPASVLLERSDGSTTTVPVDELGRFGVQRPDRGPVRLHLPAAPGRTVVTDWFMP